MKDRLIGADSSIEKATFGAALVTGSPAEASWYKIVARTADVTVFPAGYVVGDLIQGKSITGPFTAGESAALATFTVVQDATSWKWDFSKAEVDVTTLVDDVSKYRSGKADATGSLEGITFISEARKAGSLANRFVRIVNGDTAGNSAAVLSAIDKSDYFFRGVLQDDTTTGETLTFLFGQIELYGTSFGGAIGDAQSWTSNMRWIGADPILYFMDCEVATT